VTLAVLPFENVGSDAAREYLATGLTQETSASLAQIDPERLSVKGRTWRYKGTTKTAAEIGQELSVDYLVESTIRSEGGRVRVTATLLRVRDQEHVWSESYEREPTSLLGLEQELSGAIAERIRGRLSPNHAALRGGRRRMPKPMMRISRRGILKAGERPRRTPLLSSCTSARRRSIQTTPSPGPVWRSPSPGASSMAMPAPSMCGSAPEALRHARFGRIPTSPRRSSPRGT
jgi:TolB-like protein